MKAGKLRRWGRRLRTQLRLRWRSALGKDPFLCDDCKWNWRSACHRQERPNAVDCPEYTPKGR